MMRILVTLALTLLSICALAKIDEQTLNKGRAVYMQHCQTCHMAGVANAPRVHDQVAWQRSWQTAKDLTKKQHPPLTGKALDKATMKTFISETRKGKGAMPPGALCQKCSDEQYRNAIIYMMSAKP